MKSVFPLIILSTTLVLSACSSTVMQTTSHAKTQMNTPKIRLLWQLKSTSLPFKLPEKAELDLREPQHASAFMGCNGTRFTAQISPDLSSLKADTVISTRMYCSEFAQLETSFAQLLHDGAQIIWQEEKLVLVDKSGKTWVFQQAHH